MRILHLWEMRMRRVKKKTIEGSCYMKKTDGISLRVSMALKVAVLLAVFPAVLSGCGLRGNAGKDGAVKELSDSGAGEAEYTACEKSSGVQVRDSVIRAEGTGTSGSVQAALEIARLNAMTVLAGKLVPADTAVEKLPDGSIRSVQKVETPVMDVRIVDRKVFRNESSGDFTVWVLLETEMKQ